MELHRPLRAGLFIYECARILFLAGAFAAQGQGPDGGLAAFPWLACVAANALFPLMTLFLLLDSSRYGVYAPLYAAGKCVSFFSAVGWCFFSWRNMLDAALLAGEVPFMTPGVLGILVFGDLLSAAAGLVFAVKKRPARTPAGGA